ncbi:MAG: adenylate/guanylate cyclase domain-containing protein [Reyranella sp.]|nr:adenylate/guanylate cyclase domain-containing protein [Reyranella sp.]
MTPTEIAVWLANAGLRNMPLEEIVDGFGRRMNACGLGIDRMFVGMSTLHPMVRARSLVWNRTEGVAQHFEFLHAEIEAPLLQQSPFAPMLRDGRSEQRYRLDAADTPSLPVLDELKAAGLTEWSGWVVPFGELAPSVGSPTEPGHAERLWLVLSAATDRPGGYGDRDVALLRDVVPSFAIAVKATTLRSVGQGLLAAYLGDDPASRVISGTVLRGEVQSLEAVLFFADLQGFTALADTVPGRDLIALLDDYFGCMVQPVVNRGGEVLKFLGDGLLAAFAVVLDDRPAVCAAALDAAVEALSLVDRLNEGRRAAGQPAAGLDVSLHVGRVLYGNVGSDTRLDFTVIGPAVNEASRIEALCTPLGRPLLMSRAFAEAATGSRDRLVSLGRHRLRGVREETELFGLA